jgi:hypothetical protein
MTRNQLHAGMALGSAFLVAGIVAFAPPIPPASAQSQAERICREQGIKPTSIDYEYCLSQATRALEWGEPEIAYTMARVTADARDSCLEYGLAPATSGYKACMERDPCPPPARLHGRAAVWQGYRRALITLSGRASRTRLRSRRTPPRMPAVFVHWRARPICRDACASHR